MLRRTVAQLEAGLPAVLDAPKDGGRLDLIVRRPGPGERDVVEAGTLDLRDGLVGDGWLTRGSRLTPDGSAHPGRQLSVMGSRAAALLAGPASRWALSGDQLFVDLDLSDGNVGPGTRLALGAAVIEVTDQAHRGCAKFAARFGHDAFRFVNSPAGRSLRLRGVNARVVQPGAIRTGDPVARIRA